MPPKPNFRGTVKMLQEWSADMPRELGYDETGAKDKFGPWQRKARRKLRELLGFWPVQVTEPQAWRLGAEQADGFTREQWAVESPFGDHILVYRLVPDGMTKPEAIMLALHGHGTYGADPVSGLMKGRYGEEDSMRNARYDYGAQFARRGYLVYAPCQRGFAQRCDLDNPGSVEDYQVNPQVPPPGSA
ncbi:MAG: alpha/beta hydrolase family protein, partial [Armatimonadetes bacterium]|nr:alpha/beta hydrolase family protein [Armatimonadota bacterium]